MPATQPGATLTRSVWDGWTLRLRLPLTNGVAKGQGVFGFKSRGVTVVKTTFFSEFIRTAKEAPRLYFVPLIGAVRAIKAEFRRVEEAEGQTPLDPTAKQ
ncbi:hypothetical protein D3C76_949670 [compost metagenome]|nr:hypothetical protein BKX96_24330 [Pseudomonas putida]